MQVTNLNFSRAESEALREQNFFLLKDSSTKKLVAMLGELEKRLTVEFEKSGIEMEGLKFRAGKIFRGENYRLFPYVVLDYPRQFSTESIFAFRTMFWWGHEFSFTLHLQGSSLKHFRQTLIKNKHLLKGKGIYFCVNDSPWQYHFGNDNYLPVEEITDEHLWQNAAFIKLSSRIPVDKHDEVVSFGVEMFSLFMKILK